MRKRLLSILLALAMVICTAPLAVFADEVKIGRASCRERV